MRVGSSPYLPSCISMLGRRTSGACGISSTALSRIPSELAVGSCAASFTNTPFTARTRSSASLWALYIDFEIRNGELGRAKSLIYRAVRECPWCKGELLCSSFCFLVLTSCTFADLYMRPFLPVLRSVYRSSELRNWHSLLLEKGLRVRVDTNSFLEGEVGSDVEMEEQEQDEEPPLEDAGNDWAAGEDLLREREQLKPY